MPADAQLSLCRKITHEILRSIHEPKHDSKRASWPFVSINLGWMNPGFSFRLGAGFAAMRYS
jgi:hypothetical protein